MYMYCIHVASCVLLTLLLQNVIIIYMYIRTYVHVHVCRSSLGALSLTHLQEQVGDEKCLLVFLTIFCACVCVCLCVFFMSFCVCLHVCLCLLSVNLCPCVSVSILHTRKEKIREKCKC